MFSKNDRYLKVILPLVLLGFSAHATNLCPECSRAWLAVSNSIDQVDSDLVSAQAKSATFRGNLESVQNNIRSAEVYNTNLNVSQYLDDATSSLVTSFSRLSDLDDSISSARQRVAYVSGLLSSFECHCSSSSNGCPCVEILNRISDDVTFIWEEVHYNISPMMSYLSDWLEQFKTDYDNDMEWLRNRLDRFDDDYYSDLQRFHQTVYQRMSRFRESFDPESLFAQHFPSSTPSYSLGNELLVLTSIAGTSTMSAIASYDAAQSLRYIASNLNVRSFGELQFISNYLDTVQRSYYDLFNRVSRNSFDTLDPFFTVSRYKSITNAWQTLTSPTASYFDKDFAFEDFHKGQTNWFSRLEWYFLGMVGAFDSANETGLEDITEKSAAADLLGRMTNSLDLSQLSSYSNTVSDLLSRFKSTVQLFAFTKSNEDVGFTVMPSFTFGGIEFQTVVIPYSSVQPITDFVRTAFRVVWYSIFLFCGFVLFSRVVRLFIQTVAHVILIVKTLL